MYNNIEQVFAEYNYSQDDGVLLKISILFAEDDDCLHNNLFIDQV